MRFKTRLKPTPNLIDLTPLVDVIFLLLIFFIVTSDVLPLKSLKIESPRLDKDSSALTTQLLVIMDANHVIYVGSKKTIVDLTSLKEPLEAEIKQMQQIHPQVDLTVVLSVDKRVDYGNFLRLFATVQECCPKLRLVYQPEEESFSNYL